MLIVTNKAPFKRTQHCWPTTPNIVGCCMFRPCAHPVACCCVLLRVVARSLKLINFWANNSQHFFCSVIAEALRNRLHISSNIVGATHVQITYGLHGDSNALTAEFCKFTNWYGWYPSNIVLQVLTLLGVVVHHPTSAEPTVTPNQQCWELLRPFARGFKAHGWHVSFVPVEAPSCWGSHKVANVC